jgi:hypothetical protein
LLAYRAYQAQQKQQIVMKLVGAEHLTADCSSALARTRSPAQVWQATGFSLMATMMFADIKDFSTISEQMPPKPCWSG